MPLKLSGTNSVASPAYAGNDADTGLQCGSDELNLVTGGTARATVDSAGNFGVGTTSPDKLLHVNGQSRFEDFVRGSSVHNKVFVADDIALSAAKKLYLDGGSNSYIHETSADTIAVVTSGSERMRITSGGALSHSPCSGADLNGTEACGFIGDSIYAPVYKVKSALTSAKNCARFFNGNGEVGFIRMSGSATSYSTSSDYRMKENVVAIPDATTRLQQLKPSRFNFIADPDVTFDGFIAHEVQDVVPEAISGEKDAVDDDGNPVFQGIDQSKLVPLLTAALQEAIAKIETLETKVAALEAAS